MTRCLCDACMYHKMLAHCYSRSIDVQLYICSIMSSELYMLGHFLTMACTLCGMWLWWLVRNFPRHNSSNNLMRRQCAIPPLLDYVMASDQKLMQLFAPTFLRFSLVIWSTHKKIDLVYRSIVTIREDFLLKPCAPLPIVELNVFI